MYDLQYKQLFLSLLHALETVLGDKANLVAMAHMMCHPEGVELPVQPP